jgi:hypothetical protein
MEHKYIPTSQIFLGVLLFGLTILLAQQITNVLFPDEDSVRTIAKLVIDTALVAIGLGISKKVVGSAILYAGLVRFILIFFQLQGMDPALRVVVILITIVILFTVGFIKFGKNLSNHPQEVK